MKIISAVTFMCIIKVIAIVHALVVFNRGIHMLDAKFTNIPYILFFAQVFMELCDVCSNIFLSRWISFCRRSKY